MDLRYLKEFYFVVREGGFTRASRVLRVQQPALSRAVRNLESSLGVTLLIREKRGVTLTPIGKQVFESCGQVLELASSIRTLTERQKTGCRGVLRFGAVGAVASGLVPKTHVAFLKEYPDVWPMTFSGNAPALLEKISTGELEFGLFFHLPKLPPLLECETLGKIPFKLVIARQKKGSLEVRRSFIGSREVEDEGNKAFPTLERMRKDDPQVRIRVSANDLCAHKELVLEGLGVSILPEFLVQRELKSGKLIALYPQEKFCFELNQVVRKGRVLSKAASLYLERFQKIAFGPTRTSS
jgi:DNA-binding transcriptional LysR family regulator